MMALSGMMSLNLDKELTTDGTKLDYSVPLTGFPDGAVLDVVVSLTTSDVQNCSYRLTVHKHNNIGGKVSVTSDYSYGGLSMKFNATFTTLTITLNANVVGNLKISVVHLNV